MRPYLREVRGFRSKKDIKAIVILMVEIHAEVDYNEPNGRTARLKLEEKK